MSWATDGDVAPVVPGLSSQPGVGGAPHLPGAASLLEQVDKNVLVCLRDGRTFVGRLASYDQYANLVLDGAYERIVVNEVYADVPYGIFVIRGENVMLLGETAAELEPRLSSRLSRVSEPEIRAALAAAHADGHAPARFDWPILDDL